jgi:predicted TIM-barrel fold metal-dependent hydrolase
MANFSRRQWLSGVAGVSITAATGSSSRAYPLSAEDQEGTSCSLALKDFKPRSKLHVHETEVLKPKYPVFDSHTHLTFLGRGGGRRSQITYLASKQELVEVMDRKGVQVMVNLTGGYGPGHDEIMHHFSGKHSDRFVTFVEPWYHRIQESNYPQILADEVERAGRNGAKGLKVLKTLGLYLREQVDKGPLVKVDDPRFDPMWEAAGAMKMPVWIHTSDPEAFFEPIDEYNERFEELDAHPNWSFYGKDFPSDKELQEARQRMIKKHPNTTFVLCHLGNSENLDYVSNCFGECPNLYGDFSARIGELGRQPRRTRRFFEEYQDRILFGTDAVPYGFQTPQQIFGDKLYEIYYRFLETDDEYFDYAPAEIPPQGRWTISGIKLPDSILKKVYNENAKRVIGL